MNYKNPLSLNILCQSKSNNISYFKKSSTEYVALRKFNNYVKLQIIKTYSKIIDSAWVVDLASGNGQDLLKYTNIGFKNILMIDNDHNALSEIINRKYKYITSNVNSSNETYSKIFIQHLNLLDNHKQNLDIIYSNIHINDIQFIVCNFALHYIIPNKSKIINFVNMIHKLLAPGGIFIFTTFDGNKIFNLLKDKTEWNKYNSNNKLLYSIKKKYDDSIFTGINQKIDVLLPFTDGNYYTENLINLDELNTQFLKKKIQSIETDCFDKYLSKFNKDKSHFYKQITNDDKEYIYLYHYYVYQKYK
jgi:SAM-dependent methyltransferase